MKRLPCIYKATSMTTGLSYIGQCKYGIARRKNQHKRDIGKKIDKFHSALEELGWEDFEWEVLWTIQIPKTKEEIEKELNEKEKAWIEYYDSIENGYNTVSGGSGYKGKYLTLEEKQEVYNKSRREKRANITEEEKISHRTKRKQQQERNNYKAKQKIRLAKKKAAMTPEEKEAVLAHRRELRKLQGETRLIKQRAKIAARTPEKKLSDSLARSKRHKNKRANMTEEEKKEFYFKMHERAKKRKEAGNTKRSDYMKARRSSPEYKAKKKARTEKRKAFQ